MSSGSAAGGGSIELVADEGAIRIGTELICFELMQTNILRLSYYLEEIECVYMYSGRK